MKALIASDTHGRIEAVNKLEKAIAKERPDRILLLGDYLYNGPRNGVPSDYDPMAVATIFNSHKDIIIGVRGNCDSRIDNMVLEFPFEDKTETNINGHRIVMCHGDFLPDDSIVLEKGDILLSGHTHLLLIEEEGKGLHVNPGSVGFPKGGNPASYAILDENEIIIVDLDNGNVILRKAL